MLLSYKILGKAFYLDNVIILIVYFSIWFFRQKTINTYLKLKICVVCGDFLAFKYIFFSRKKSDVYLYLYITSIWSNGNSNGKKNVPKVWSTSWFKALNNVNFLLQVNNWLSPLGDNWVWSFKTVVTVLLLSFVGKHYFFWLSIHRLQKRKMFYL